jgi:hypothetical protein
MKSGISTDSSTLPKVTAEKGKRIVGKIVSADRGQLVTVVYCFSASDVYGPLANFPAKECAMNYILQLPLELYLLYLTQDI